MWRSLPPMPDAYLKPALATDPVCHMKVDPAKAKANTTHNGATYYFCCQGCHDKFLQAPEKYLQPPALPLVTLTGAPKPAATKAKPVAEPQSSQPVEYICPMDPEVHESKPGACPICGMALESAQISLSNTRTEYTCPMHPEIVRPEPGSCPICGMALEPRTVTVEEKNPELDDMRRRFWIATALTIPLACDHGGWIPRVPSDREPAGKNGAGLGGVCLGHSRGAVVRLAVSGSRMEFPA